jgi:Helix-turn-helix domain
MSWLAFLIAFMQIHHPGNGVNLQENSEMSYDAQSWARKLVTGNGVRKAVLMSIANRANDADGACWPSQRRIAAETEFCERAVRNALADLEETGLIRREKRKDTTDLIYLVMEDPGDGSTVKPPASPAGTGGGRSRASSTQRHQIALSAARDAGDARNQTPAPAAPDAGTPRHEMPTNLSVEPITEPIKETTKKGRGPAAPFPADAFDQFWALYPHKIGKGYARSLFKKLADTGTVEFETLVSGVRFYIKTKPADRPWCNPSTWLNQERWEDQPATLSTHGEIRANRSAAI